MEWITVRHSRHGRVAKVAERSLAMWRRRGWEEYEPAAETEEQAASEGDRSQSAGEQPTGEQATDEDAPQPTPQPQARSTSRRRGRANQPNNEE